MLTALQAVNKVKRKKKQYTLQQKRDVVAAYRAAAKLAAETNARAASKDEQLPVGRNRQLALSAFVTDFIDKNPTYAGLTEQLVHNWLKKEVAGEFAPTFVRIFKGGPKPCWEFERLVIRDLTDIVVKKFVGDGQQVRLFASGGSAG